MTSTKVKHSVRRSRGLRLETLEDRKMMAGDVAVALEGQLMTIHGDNLANQTVAAQDAVGKFRSVAIR